MDIQNVTHLKQHFHKGRANAYAWPGGYPLFYLCADGETLCPTCVTKERKRIFRATRDKDERDWTIVGVDVNWEDGALYCAHCSEHIPSAYEVSNWTNFYVHCGLQWSEEWSCQVNDKCPLCHREIEPYASHDDAGNVTLHVGADFVPENGWPVNCADPTDLDGWPESATN